MRESEMQEPRRVAGPRIRAPAWRAVPSTGTGV